MSGRGPEPKELRASLVDSGWSSAPPPVEEGEHRSVASAEITPREVDSRRLPNYEELSQAPVVTQVDTEIQARLRAMQRASLADSHRPPIGSSLPPPPPPRPSRPVPPSLPPPPRPSSLPPSRPSAAPLPSFAPPSPTAEPRLPQFSTTVVSDFGAPEPSEVSFGVGAQVPASDPAELRAPAPPTFSFGPASSAPSPLTALKQRVRFAGGEVPLWSLLAPMVLLLTLGSAFAAAAFGNADERPVSVGPAPSAN